MIVSARLRLFNLGILIRWPFAEDVRWCFAVWTETITLMSKKLSTSTNQSFPPTGPALWWLRIKALLTRSTARPRSRCLLLCLWRYVWQGEVCTERGPNSIPANYISANSYGWQVRPKKRNLVHHTWVRVRLRWLLIISSFCWLAEDGGCQCYTKGVKVIEMILLLCRWLNTESWVTQKHGI